MAVHTEMQDFPKQIVSCRHYYTREKKNPLVDWMLLYPG